MMETERNYLKKAEQREGMRISRFLLLLEKDSVYDFSENSPYTESILSREVKQYFGGFSLSQDFEPDEEAISREEDLLEQICSLFQLDPFEKMCVELTFLGEINPYFEKFNIYMNNDWNQGFLTPDTAIRLYTMEMETDGGLFRYFSERSKLRRYFLSLYEQSGKGKLRWGLKCRNSLFQFLCSNGEDVLGDYTFLQWWKEAEVQPFLNDSLLSFDSLESVIEQTKDTVCLYGLAEKDMLRFVKQYGKRREQDICFIDIRQMAQHAEKNNLPFMEIVYDVALQIAVKNGWICLYFLEKEWLEKPFSRELLNALMRTFREQGLKVFIIREKSLFLAKHYPDIWEFSVESTGCMDDIHIWEEAAKQYKMESDLDLPFFAGTYRFHPIQIARIFESADRIRQMRQADMISRADIKESCIREVTGQESHPLVTVTQPCYDWDDLVLPDRPKGMLKDACNRIRYKHEVFDNWGFGEKLAYGRGVSMVFSGPPGTGKTMSAGVVADCLGTTLYKVELAAVVSKYIGETEKNLSAVFEAAKKGQGVLFFDEADVLFGRRTEVKNSNDKHSNMEAAYLLQKMEEYNGIVILATNYMQNIDEAFKRRIQFIIEFSLPDKELRKQIWEQVFPKQTLFEEKPDYDFLAEHFALSGSHIKNIALQAAFYAADKQKGVNMELIIKALLAEIRKTGKRITREELREYDIYFEQI